MESKVAYITGGTKGIGAGIARVLAENGITVAVSGRNAGDDARFLQISSDVRRLQDEENAVKIIVEKFGRLDFVIANAGLGFFKPVEELSSDEWNAMIDTNLTGCFNTLKAALPALKKSKGYYITISSLAGTNFFENASGYNASKFGVVGFTQAAMLDLRKYDIKVSTIMPGSVSSNFNGHEPSESDAWKIQPEDIGQIVLDLVRMNPRTLPSKVEVRPTKPGK